MIMMEWPASVEHLLELLGVVWCARVIRKLMISLEYGCNAPGLKEH